MRYLTLIPLFAALSTALPTTSNTITHLALAIAARAPPEAKAVLRSVNSTGTGCAPNSAAFLIKDDATLGFDALVVDTEQSAAKRCLVSIDLGLDSKWTYTINRASDVRGYVENASADFRATFSVNGKTSNASGIIDTSSAKNGNYLLHFAQSGVSSATGGGIATIDIALMLKNGTSGFGTVTVDTLDIGFAYAKSRV